MSEENVSEDVPESVPKERSQREQGLGNMEKCPVIPDYVQDFQKCCAEYSEGKQTDLDVIANVVQTLRKLRGESHE